MNATAGQYRKKPVIITAQQWKYGPGWAHPMVKDYSVDGDWFCSYCGRVDHCHGYIETLEGGHIVCQNDWIICGVAGEYYPCKPDIFQATYEMVLPGEEGFEQAGRGQG